MHEGDSAWAPGRPRHRLGTAVTTAPGQRSSAPTPRTSRESRSGTTEAHINSDRSASARSGGQPGRVIVTGCQARANVPPVLCPVTITPRPRIGTTSCTRRAGPILHPLSGRHEVYVTGRATNLRLLFYLDPCHGVLYAVDAVSPGDWFNVPGVHHRVRRQVPSAPERTPRSHVLLFSGHARA